MVNKIERILIVYGTKKGILKFLEHELEQQALGEGLKGAEETNLIEIQPATEHFRELKHGLIKGFEE